MAEAAAPPPHDHFPPPEFSQPSKVGAQLISRYTTTYLLPAGHDGAGGGKAEAVPERFHPLTDAPPPLFARMIHAQRPVAPRPGVQTALTAIHKRQVGQGLRLLASGEQRHVLAAEPRQSISSAGRAGDGDACSKTKALEERAQSTAEALFATEQVGRASQIEPKAILA